MITILIGGLLGAFIGWYIHKVKDWEIVGCIYIGTIIGVCIYGFIASFFIKVESPKIREVYSLVTLHDNQGIRGTFFLGCGRINDRMTYVFYYDAGGYYKMKQIDCMDNVQIKYTSGPPCFIIEKEDWTKNLFAIRERMFHPTYILQIPEGSIKNNFTLDAQ